MCFVLRSLSFGSRDQSTKHEAPGTALLSLIVISYLSNLWKGYLDNVAVGTFHFDAWRGECLCSFKTMNDSADSASVCGENLDVWFTVKRLERRQGFRHFQCLFVPPTNFNQPC